MINYFVSKRVKIFTSEYDGLKIYTDDKSKQFSINDLEKIILKNTEINMKLSFKDIIDAFPEYGIRVSTDNFINENIMENKIKVIHHDHAFSKRNMFSFICRECNLQIKNDKKIPLYFFNGSKYFFFYLKVYHYTLHNHFFFLNICICKKKKKDSTKKNTTQKKN